jgi:hypothetical protein
MFSHIGLELRPAREADNLTAICEPIVYKMWQPRRLTTLRAFMACYRDSFMFLGLDIPGGVLLLVFLAISYTPFFSPMRAAFPAHLIWRGVQIIKLAIMQISSVPYHFTPLGSKY